jgi:hypothetical protein
MLDFYDRPLKKTPQFRSPQEPSTSIAAASGAFLSVIFFYDLHGQRSG